MYNFRALLFILLIMKKVTNEVISTIENHDYAGEKFPKKYFVIDDHVPTMADVNTYLNSIMKITTYFAKSPNKTNVNEAIGLFMTKSVLKRALRDDRDKFQEDQRKLVNHLINKASYIISHYIFYNMRYASKYGQDLECQVASLLRDADSDILAKSLGQFNRNKLQKWILSKSSLNNYLEEFDTATLPKNKYAKLVDESIFSYNIKIRCSDICAARVIHNYQPSEDNTELRPCRPDPFCHKNIHASPSIAYSLSHRLLNMVLYRHIRHCYWVSPEDDELHIDMLCSFMYREAVYLARRGFFARDLFLEHIALCGFMGYEEFFRIPWFRKAISWMNEEGCIYEDRNFQINRSYNIVSDPEITKKRREILKRSLVNECQEHPMSVLLITLSHALRHAIRFLPML